MSVEQVENLVKETRELHALIKAEHKAMKDGDESRSTELKAALDKCNAVVEIAEQAKEAAEKAEATAKTLSAMQPMLQSEKSSDIEALYEKKLTPEELSEHREHKRLIKEFLRKGDQFFSEKEIKFLKDRTKAMTGVSDPSGGYVIVPEMDTAITRVAYETSPVRQYATVKTISTDQYEKLQRVDLAGAAWVDRLAGPTETTTPTYQKLIIRVNGLAAMPAIHQLALDDAAVNLENEVITAVATEFELSENTAFVSGDGNGQPTGFLSYTAGSGYDYTVASIIANWGKIEQVVAGSTTAVQYDGLVNLITALKDVYHANANWFMNRGTRGAVRLLKNGVGDPMWAPGLAGQPSELFGYPVAIAADMPAIGSGALSIAFGDFARGYSVIDRMGTRLLRDPYTNKPYIMYYTTKRLGGGVDNYEAIKLQVFNAS